MQVTVLRVRKDGFAPAAKKLAIGEPNAGARLMSLFWILLGPLVGAMLYWLLNLKRW